MPAANPQPDATAMTPKVSPNGDGRKYVLWPTAIGSVSIAFGIMGLLNMLSEMLNIGINILMNGRIGSNFLGYGIWEQIATCGSVLQGLNGGLLLGAGFLLIRRVRPAHGLHIVFAVLAIVLGALVLLGHVLTTSWSHSWHYIFWRVYSAATGMIYPVILLSWFFRPGVRRQVAQWRRPGQAPAIPAGNARDSQ